MPLYYVAAYGGHCNLVMADTIAEARSEAVLDVGRDNFNYIRPATREDLDWVSSMQGGIEYSIYDLEEAMA